MNPPPPSSPAKTHRIARLILAVAALSGLAAAGWWLGDIPQVQAPAPRIADDALGAHAAYGRGPLLPLTEPPQAPPDKVALGRRLFFDTRLSRDNTVSCASCHNLDRGGADGRQFSVGIDGQIGTINAPTVFNAAYNLAQFWDGRAATLEEQVSGPVHNPIEMGSNWPQVLSKLSADESYVAAFRQSYAQGITGVTIADAIAAFERTLWTPNSRFDRYLRGDHAALNALEVAGYRRFLDLGCASCHQGANIGGNMFQRFGVKDDYFRGRPPRAADLGRFNVTGREADRNVFKVPSLRNVARTSPYFHDGSARSLDEAVVVMGRYQLGRDMSRADVASIVAFLQTLTGEWQGDLPR